MKTTYTHEELRQMFEDKGYSVIKVIQRRPDSDTYVCIRNRSKLTEASEFGRTLGVIVSTPC